MRPTRSAFLLFVTFLISIPVVAQQPPQRDPQAIALLQRAYAALSGGQAISDVTLTGTARRVAGSDDETGTAILKALATGASRLDHSFPSGQRSEVRNTSANPPAGSWSGPDRISHAIPYHNLMTDPSWFFPAFLIGRVLSSSNYVAAYVGHETRDSVAVEHLTISQTFATSPQAGALLRHLSQIEIYLDSGTLLPVTLAFNVHPDKDAGLDIPVEIRFSDYRRVSGAQVPFHIQKYLNNTLVLDLQFQTVALNTGLTGSAFSIQ